jgi:peptidoglycan/xylan/chitin deacetylase (PgdA/CDA1 family)
MKPSYKLLILFLIFLAECNAPPTPAPVTPPTKKPLVFKNTTVSLTFDDGDADNYAVREALAKNNLHATFYIISGFIGKKYMTEEQLRGLFNDGNEIGGHSLNHSKLTGLDGADLKYEICQDRLNLLALGFNVTSFAYPFGHYDQESKQIVKDCGYNNARIVADGPETIPVMDPFAARAMPYIVPDTRLPKMLRYITQVEEMGGGWAIFIFHHVCDNCDKFAVAPDTFIEFANWLGAQQANGLVIKTVGEEIGGETQPGVSP